ncbi:MAG: hypothetical protein IKI06_01325 [Prevotella sp.]|nr:hypothetical protein [Prevotella sp.]
MKKDILGQNDKGLSEAVDHFEETGMAMEELHPEWKGLVAGESMRWITLKEDKVYWERKYVKDTILGLKNRLGIKLTDEYEEKLEKLDDFRPGEDVSLPYATGINKDENYELVLKLSPYFSDDAAIRRFLEKVAGKKDKEIAILVKKFKKANLCTDTSRALWNVLHEAGLFETDYPNWNRLI